jgi:hypothetical protein
MIKAHSLLYAVYICLLVAVLCAGLLYFAGLYTQLNLMYTSREELYIQNQSYTELALANQEEDSGEYNDAVTGIGATYKNRTYGLLHLLEVTTFAKSDTVTAVYLTGDYPETKTCLFLTNQGDPFYYSGNVKLIGEKKIATLRLEEKYITNAPNSLVSQGNITLSETYFPEIFPEIKELFEEKYPIPFTTQKLEVGKDTIYFNSFVKEPVHIQLTGTVLEQITIKGNYILHARDSVYIKNTALLEDVIIRAPKIKVEENFKGNAQLLATQKITIQQGAQLTYPSVLCLYNKTSGKSLIEIQEKAKIYGAVVLVNDSVHQQEEDAVVVKKEALLLGELYCMGKLMVEGKVYGAAYANRVFHKTSVSNYDNCMVDSEIDITRRPEFFVSVPVLKTTVKKKKGVCKKVL